jgi:nucleoredoxin
MPWVALPFGDTRIGQLKQQHNVTGIPCLVVLKKDGSVLVANGRGDVTSSGVKAFENWVAASK